MNKLKFFAILAVPILALAGSSAAQEDEYHEILTIGRGQVYGLEWEEGSNRLIARTRDNLWFYDEQLELVGSSDYDLIERQSPDGTMVAVPNEDLPGIEIIDWATGEIISVLEGEVDRFVGRAWSPNSRLLAISRLNGNNEVLLWDREVSSVKAVFSAGDERLYRLIWSPDSQYLIGVNLGRSIFSWNVDGLELVAQRDNYPPSGNPFDIVWNPSRNQIAVTRSDEDEGIHAIEILMIPSLEREKVLVGHTADISRIAWIDETHLVSADEGDYSIRLWNTETSQVEMVLEGHTDWVGNLEYNPTLGLLASSSSDSSIRLWDIDEGVQVAQTQGHNRSIMSMAWSPDGEFIATAGFTDDPRIRIWDAATNELLVVLEGHTDWIAALSWHPDGALLASGSTDGTIKIWDTTTYTLVKTLIDTIPEHRNEYSFRDIEWSPDGTLLASTTTFDDRIWDVESGAVIFLRETTYDRWGQNSVTWCSDGEILAISLHAFIRIIDLEQQEISLEIDHPVYSGWQNEVLCYDEQLVVVGDSGAFIDLTTGRVTREFSGIGAAAWHPSGSLLATAHGNHFYILNASDLSTVAAVDTGKPYSIGTITWSPDGTHLAVGFSSEEVIHVWAR